jgi:SAM-dependent methyltransferase
MMLPTTCPACEGKQITLLWSEVSNADGTVSGASHVLRCSDCGAGLTWPLPTPTDLANQYTNGIYKNSGGRAFGIVNTVLSAFADTRLRTLGWYKQGRGNLLDVGCGKGRFVYRAKKAGWKAVGLEISLHQAESARNRFDIPVVVGTIDQNLFEPASFDVISAWHVMEHVTDLGAFVAGITRALRPGGIFACEVPNFASCQAQIGGPLWFQLDVPRHITHFTPSALQTLLAKHNLTLLAQRTFSPELGLFGMLQTLSNRTGLPVNLLFRWLKRATTDNSHVARTLLSATLLAFPALILEGGAALLGRGGVLQVVARRAGQPIASEDMVSDDKLYRDGIK